MLTKDYLNKIRQQNLLIKSLEQEYQELQSIKGLHAVSLLEKVSGGTKVDLSGVVIKLQAYCEKVQKEYEKISYMRTIAKKLIFKLDNPIYQTLLINRYINCLTWEQVAVNMSYSYRQITRMHGEALLDLEKIYKDVLECPTQSVIKYKLKEEGK